MGRLGHHSRPGPFGRKVNTRHRIAVPNRQGPFYSDPSVSHGDTVEDELAGAEAGAGAAARYPTHRPEPGAAEQQPGDWLNAFTSVTLGLARAVAVERWQAVGLSAMLPTLVLTDGVGAAATPGGIDAPSSRRHLEPLGPAITWEDGRGEPRAARSARASAATPWQAATRAALATDSSAIWRVDRRRGRGRW
jgi:hypothetical protein